METLASRIERDGGLQEADAVGWAIRLARTVELIHDRGRVHGRLSAAGVRIGGDESSAAGELLAFVDLPENVAYHSPDRERGEGGSQADDTWAVAVLLYYALAGSLPFSGANDDDVRRKIRTVPAPPLAVFDVGDDELQAIVDRALARSREGRTQTVTALRIELESWQPELQLGELPALASEEELDEEVTVIHSSRSQDLRRLIELATETRAKAASAKAAGAPAQARVATPGGSLRSPGIPAAPASAPRIPGGALPEIPAVRVPRGPPITPTLADKEDDNDSDDEHDDPFSVPVPDARAKLRASTPPEPPSSTKAQDNPGDPPATPASAPAPARVSSVPASTPSPASTPAPARASSVPTPSPVPGLARAVAEAALATSPRSRAPIIVLFVLVAVAIGIVAFVLSEPGAPERTPGKMGETPMPVPSPTHAEPTSAPSATVSAQPVSAAVPSIARRHPRVPTSLSSAVAAPPGKADLLACVSAIFPPDSFDQSSEFSFVCSETDANKIGASLRTELVRARHNITDGMRDWALMGWYELPAVALVRARCCPSSPPLKLPDAGACVPVGGLLDAITTRASAATDPGDKTLLAAMAAYTNDVYCLVRSGASRGFGHKEPPEGGQDTTFMRFVGRFIAGASPPHPRSGLIESAKPSDAGP